MNVRARRAYIHEYALRARFMIVRAVGTPVGTCTQSATIVRIMGSHRSRRLAYHPELFPELKPKDSHSILLRDHSVRSNKTEYHFALDFGGSR